MPEAMRIVELSVSNIKRISAVSIRPDGSLVQISGENDQGKTTLLDTIFYGLAGTRNIPKTPIRKGAKKGEIKIDLGAYRVTRTFTAQDGGEFTTGLKVEKADGSRPASPQALLDSFLGEYSYDPLAWALAAPAVQFNTMRAFVPGVDFDALALADKEDREKRTSINRRAKELRAQADGIVLPAGKVPKLVDVSALETKLGEASNHNSELAQRKARRQQTEDEVQRLTEEIARLTEQRAALQAKLDAAPPLEAAIDVTALTEELRTAREGNKVAEAARRRDDLNAQAKVEEDASEALTKAIEQREADKQKAIAAAKMPVPGLSFGDGEILMNGVSFSEASKSAKIKAGVAIAAALNPTIRIITIRDASVLDTKTRAWLAEFAEANDMQVWIELVEAGDVGFVIEDGHLKGDAPAPEEFY